MTWAGMDDREIRDRANEIHEYVTRGADEREQNADRRSANLVRVHEQGWKLVADAIGRGLKDIAAAIREHGR
jgi:hypothetical protein